MAGTAVAQVVAVDAGDHHIAQFERGNRLGQVVRLAGIERVGPAVADVAKRAAAGAFVTHDHEGGRALAKTFADIGAAGLFADRDQLVLAQDVLDLIKAGAGTCGLDADPVGLFQHLGLLDLDGYARELGGRLLFGQRVVVFETLRLAHGGLAHGVFRFRGQGWR
jgi:hypothetical protein